jgi:hypothetical protein
MSDDRNTERVPMPAVPREFEEMTGRRCPANSRTLTRMGIDCELPAFRAENGRLYVLRRDIPRLEDLILANQARAMARMRHAPVPNFPLAVADQKTLDAMVAAAVVKYLAARVPEEVAA